MGGIRPQDEILYMAEERVEAKKDYLRKPRSREISDIAICNQRTFQALPNITRKGPGDAICAIGLVLTCAVEFFGCDTRLIAKSDWCGEPAHATVSRTQPSLQRLGGALPGSGAARIAGSSPQLLPDIPDLTSHSCNGGWPEGSGVESA